MWRFLLTLDLRFHGENEAASAWLFLLLKWTDGPLARRFWPPFLSHQKAWTYNSIGRPKLFQVKKYWTGDHLTCSWELLIFWAQGTASDFLPALSCYIICLQGRLLPAHPQYLRTEGQSKVKHIWKHFFCLIILSLQMYNLNRKLSSIFVFVQADRDLSIQLG